MKTIAPVQLLGEPVPISVPPPRIETFAILIDEFSMLRIPPGMTMTDELKVPGAWLWAKVSVELTVQAMGAVCGEAIRTAPGRSDRPTRMLAVVVLMEEATLKRSVL